MYALFADNRARLQHGPAVLTELLCRNCADSAFCQPNSLSEHQQLLETLAENIRPEQTSACSRHNFQLLLTGCKSRVTDSSPLTHCFWLLYRRDTNTCCVCRLCFTRTQLTLDGSDMWHVGNIPLALILQRQVRCCPPVWRMIYRLDVATPGVVCLPFPIVSDVGSFHHALPTRAT